MSHQLIIKGSLRRTRFTLDLDLDVDLSRPLGILGTTGAGKTTLLRVIAGLERDFRGVSSFAGRSGTTATILIGCRPINGVWVWFFRTVDCCPGARLRAILPLPSSAHAR